jgi:hypothetical protein
MNFKEQENLVCILRIKLFLRKSSIILVTISPYAKTLFWRKIANSFIDAIFAATSNLYLIAK